MRVKNFYHVNKNHQNNSEKWASPNSERYLTVKVFVLGTRTEPMFITDICQNDRNEKLYKKNSRVPGQQPRTKLSLYYGCKTYDLALYINDIKKLFLFISYLLNSY